MRAGAEALVCNTGPLIALAKIEKVDLLSALFPRVLVPDIVWEELTHAGRVPEAALLQPGKLGLEIVTNPPPIDPLLIAQLDAGEAAVLTLARNTPCSLALIDERKARHVADVIYKLPVLGTGGLLLRAKRNGLLPEIRPLFQQLLGHGYYLSDRIIERICLEAGEVVVHERQERYG